MLSVHSLHWSWTSLSDWPSLPGQKGLGARIVLEHSVNKQGNVQTCMEMNFQFLYFIYGSLSSSLYTAFITGGGMLFLPGKHWQSS